MSDAYFFGCVKRTGHYLVDTDLRHVHDPSDFPWKLHQIDGKLQPGCRSKTYGLSPTVHWETPNVQPEGLAKLHHKDGWTALSFWDRSVDKRLASNANFFFRGEHDFDEMLELARKHLPSITDRFNFEIRLAKET